MEIKQNITSSTAHSLRPRGVFRSVKYRVRLPLSPAIHLYEDRQQTAIPFRRDIFSTLRVKRTAPTRDQSPMNRTSMDWSYMLPKQPPQDRSDYLESFCSLMGSRAVAKRNSMDWKMKSRINLPSLEQNEQSRFCTLDPMTVTIDYIDEMYNDSQLLLKKNQQDAEELSTELKDLEKKANKIFQSLQKQIMGRVEMLRQAVRHSGAKHVQNKLECKKQIDILEKQIEQTKSTFDGCLEKTQQLQHRIFHALPYELVEDPQMATIHEPFTEKLF